MKLKFKKKLAKLYFEISYFFNRLSWIFHDKGIYLEREIYGTDRSNR